MRSENGPTKIKLKAAIGKKSINFRTTSIVATQGLDSLLDDSTNMYGVEVSELLVGEL